MSNIFILKSDNGKPLKLDHAIDIEPHIAVLRTSSNIEEIRLGGNSLGVEACKALADILKSKTNLKVLNAADIFTGRLISEIPDALTALLTALLTLPHLHTVDLSDNAFGGRLAEPLRGFYSKAGPLRHLYLNNNGLGPTGGTIIANAIKDLASLKDANPYLLPLETLVCGRNRLENGSMDAWAGAYAAHKSLKTVKMVQNGIRPAGIDKLLRDGLSHCTGLLNLDLQDNTFTITGAHALADVITRWSQLETLCVGDCLLSAQGGILLGQALQLKKNVRLKMLSLQYNEIDIKAVRVFLTTLQDALPNLEMIELNGNKFSEDDTLIEEFRQLFSERGFEGLDSLSDMEGESDVEVKEDEYEVARSIEDAQRVGKNVMVQKKNVSLDDLSEFLEAIEIA